MECCSLEELRTWTKAENQEHFFIRVQERKYILQEMSNGIVLTSLDVKDLFNKKPFEWGNQFDFLMELTLWLLEDVRNRDRESEAKGNESPPK